jgi:hypothetical protein
MLAFIITAGCIERRWPEVVSEKAICAMKHGKGRNLYGLVSVEEGGLFVWGFGYARNQGPLSQK